MTSYVMKPVLKRWLREASALVAQVDPPRRCREVQRMTAAICEVLFWILRESGRDLDEWLSADPRREALLSDDALRDALGRWALDALIRECRALVDASDGEWQIPPLPPIGNRRRILNLYSDRQPIEEVTT